MRLRVVCAGPATAVACPEPTDLPWPRVTVPQILRLIDCVHRARFQLTQRGIGGHFRPKSKLQGGTILQVRLQPHLRLMLCAAAFTSSPAARQNKKHAQAVNAHTSMCDAHIAARLLTLQLPAERDGPKPKPAPKRTGEKRFDPNCPKGKNYTRAQFVKAYGRERGPAHWDACVDALPGQKRQALGLAAVDAPPAAGGTAADADADADAAAAGAGSATPGAAAAAAAPVAVDPREAAHAASMSNELLASSIKPIKQCMSGGGTPGTYELQLLERPKTTVEAFRKRASERFQPPAEAVALAASKPPADRSWPPHGLRVAGMAEVRPCNAVSSLSPT